MSVPQTVYHKQVLITGKCAIMPQCVLNGDHSSNTIWGLSKEFTPLFILNKPNAQTFGSGLSNVLWRQLSGLDPVQSFLMHKCSCAQEEDLSSYLYYIRIIIFTLRFHLHTILWYQFLGTRVYRKAFCTAPHCAQAELHWPYIYPFVHHWLQANILK